MIQIIRETHQPAASVARRLYIAGGSNRFGEPNYRAVWGWSRLGWVGGKWEDHDEAGGLLREVAELRYVPKYTPQNRWHIERWLPPEAYGSPLDWYGQTMERAGGCNIPALGPYPDRGEYEHCFTLEDAQGGFLQLTPTVAEYIARAIETGRHSDPARRRSALQARQNRAEKGYDDWAWEMLNGGSARAIPAAP